IAGRHRGPSVHVLQRHGALARAITHEPLGDRAVAVPPQNVGVRVVIKVAAADRAPGKIEARDRVIIQLREKLWVESAVKNPGDFDLVRAGGGAVGDPRLVTVVALKNHLVAEMSHESRIKAILARADDWDFHGPGRGPICDPETQVMTTHGMIGTEATEQDL